MNGEQNQLTQIFELQNTTFAKHVQEFGALFQALSSVIDVIGSPELDQTSWENLPEVPKTIFNYFYSDSFSSLASAIRLAFHGVDTDCYALLRVVVENLTILEYIIENDLYEEAFTELQERVGKNRPFSEKFSYKTAVQDLQVDPGRRRFWRELSTVGSHSSPLRLRWSRLEFGGIPYYKVGVGIENPGIRSAIENCLKLAVHFGQVMGTFYSEFEIDGEDEYEARLSELVDRSFESP